jgi:hypothetical protein
LKLNRIALSLVEQISNSFWSFLALRFAYTERVDKEIALLGITIMFSYSCSGLLRSKFIYPLFSEFGEKNSEVKFNMLELLNWRILRYLLLCTTILGIYLESQISFTEDIYFELLILACSIVFLDFLRGFMQLNSEFMPLLLTNTLGLIVFITCSQIADQSVLAEVDIRYIDIWTLTNLIGCGLLFLMLVKKSRVKTIFLSPTNDVSTKIDEFSRLSIFDFVIGRGLNLVGTAILLQISASAASALTLALFVYSTLPFSVLNGLAPQYLRNRKVVDARFTMKKYLSTIGLAAFAIPVVDFISPDSFLFVFGFKSELPTLTIIFVLCMVFQKSYESAKSLDFMMTSSSLRYITTKTLLNIAIFVVSFLLMGLGYEVLAIFVLTISIFIQIPLFKARDL